MGELKENLKAGTVWTSCKIDKPEQLLQNPVKQVIGQENKGVERSSLACVIQEVSASQIDGLAEAFL